MFNYSNIQFLPFKISISLLLMACFLPVFSSDKPSWSVELPEPERLNKLQLIIQNVNPHMKNSRKELEQDMMKMKPAYKQLTHFETVNINSQAKKKELNIAQNKTGLNAMQNPQVNTGYKKPKLIGKVKEEKRKTISQFTNLKAKNIHSSSVKNKYKNPSILTTDKNLQATKTMIKPNLIKGINPRYPLKELKEKKQGWVELMLELSKSGTVLQSTLIKQSEDNNRNFLRAAQRVVKFWKYDPITITNTLKVKIRISFKLPS